MLTVSEHSGGAGWGRVVQLYHDECAEIWGSSPAVQPTIGLASASPIAVDTEVDLAEGDVEETLQMNNILDQSATSGGGMAGGPPWTGNCKTIGPNGSRGG